MDSIRIRGARTHNLKNLDLDLPRNRLIVFTGLSGSGKSSLAFDTIYAEGQRRYVESLSAYARQFLSMLEKPDVDQIDGLSPAISIDQKTTSHNPRSTVGTITEIYDYLRLLFARVGQPHCPVHGESLAAQTISQMVDQILQLPAGKKVMLLAPIISARKGEYQRLFTELLAQGFTRARIDGRIYELDNLPSLEARQQHTIEVIIDRFRIRLDLAARLAESLETALCLSHGIVRIAWIDSPELTELTFSARFACSVCGYNLPELEPRLFSFNNPVGACPVCTGLGVTQYCDPQKVVINPELSLAAGAIRGWSRDQIYPFSLLSILAERYQFSLDMPWQDLPRSIHKLILYGEDDNQANDFKGILSYLEHRYRETTSPKIREEIARLFTNQTCPSCQGTRLIEAARHVWIETHTLPNLTCLPVEAALAWCESLQLPGQRGVIATKIIREVITRLRFLVEVGLAYLTLDRSAETLSGGEAQRIRLASQIGAGLVGVLYILDEPSIGLHPRDNARLLRTLAHLRDLGNTVIVVEHDAEAMQSADWIVDLGPGAGIHGGKIVAAGTFADLLQIPQSLTGRYLAGELCIAIPSQRKPCDPQHQLKIIGARGNNLHEIDVEIPIGTFCCITGVSGSGKSTLINDTLYPAAAARLQRANTNPAPHQTIIGFEYFTKIIAIDQSPIGRTPRSNPATYTGLFDFIREVFASVPEARARGYRMGRFSFNVKGGRCEACQGDGLIRVAMHFLPDIFVTCDVCQGRRYNRETLEIRFKNKSISDVLQLTIIDAQEFFASIPAIQRKLQTLIDVGLSYLSLGQSATTLSGGEAQRVKLSRELSRRDTGRTLYLLDEPTTGLHFHDVKQLLTVLHRLRDQGNTIIVIEHNLDVIKTADWIIDLGPEGGDQGGRVVATGTPESIAAHPKSHTGRALRPLFNL